jgi:hypothetical protein
MCDTMNMKKIGIALAILSVFGLIGMVGATSVGSQTVTASYTGTYTAGTCVLQTEASTVDLSSGAGTINVYNNGVAGSSGPTTMTVTIAYSDYFPSVGYAESNGAYGWYNPGVAWTPGMYTNWLSNEYNSVWTTVTGTNQTATTPYDNLASGTSTWSPISLQVLGVPSDLPASTTLNQQLVLTGSC